MDVFASFALVEVADQDNPSIRLLRNVGKRGEDGAHFRDAAHIRAFREEGLEWVDYQ